MKLGYSIKVPENAAKAMGKELKISPKKAYELANAIRGKKVEKAKAYLEQVIEKKVAVPYKRYKKGIPHRRGMDAGRYPVNAAKSFLKVIQNAESSANKKNLPKEKLKIVHLSVNRGRVVVGRRKGFAYNTNTVNLQVVLGEADGKRETIHK